MHSSPEINVMLTEEAKQEIRDRLAAVSRAMPGFRSRPSQRQMIAEVARTFARLPDGGKPTPGETILLVQGGTGTGKSLGYSLAGMIMAQRKGKKLVISSSSVALQEQLINRDLPLFVGASGIKTSVEIAKGRTRYLCQYRLHQAVSDQEQIALFDRDAPPATGAGAAEIRKDLVAMATEFASGSWDGDRDTRDAVSDEAWKMVTTDRHGCLNRNCPSIRSCTQMAARKRLREASVIVANHDLLLADLAMGGGKILPPPSDCFYVIDEAHHLPEKAVASFAASHQVHSARRAVERLAGLARTFRDALGPGFAATSERIRDEAEQLRGYLSDIYGFLGSLAQLKPTKECPRPTLEFDQSCLPEEFFEVGESIKALSNALVGLVEHCLEALESLATSNRTKQPQLEKVLAEAGIYRGVLEVIHVTWDLFLAEPDTDAPPVAKWIEAATHRNSLDFQINASPVYAGQYLRRLFWEKAAGVVMTSATMTTLGNFDDFKKRAGLKGLDISCVNLPSPFDYARQGLIDIPSMPNPKDYEAHTAALTGRLIDDMNGQTGEGMLVLFTSRRQMLDVADRLPAALRPRVLVQGDQPKSAIIAAHRRAIDAGRPSAIFGLDSFTEGVDLPAQYCTEVVITRLPFAVPDNPVLRTLSGWIERCGGNAFMEISIPDAARKLEQRVGRLIRTETDRGKVVVTDPRLWQSRYGRAMLRGLPPFRLVAMGKEVKSP